jgi:hypothetical protein
MAVFVALNHPHDTMQVNITMSDEAVRGTWYRETTSNATLDYENGEFFQITYAGSPREDRQLRGPDNSVMLVLRDFLRNRNSGDVSFAIEGGPGSFGTGEAGWTRLEGASKSKPKRKIVKAKVIKRKKKAQKKSPRKR